MIVSSEPKFAQINTTAAGFTGPNPIGPNDISKSLRKERDSLRSLHLKLAIKSGVFGREHDHKEIEAFQQADTLSGVWILQTPTQRGFMEAEVFREVVTTFMGTPSYSKQEARGPASGIVGEDENK